MGKIEWQRLTLRGFGCYREEKVLELHEGFNLYIAPNEEGKSTLVAGLVAVLYGLAGISDPSKYGKAKFQNWDGAREFNGELEFTVHGRAYRLTRDFASDRVVLAILENEGWKELAGGEHRARARRMNVSYAETLAGLIGLGSRELFEGTFCLTQPFARAASLDKDILQLLSGSTGSYPEALKSLAASVTELTRYTRELGVATRMGVALRNQRSDRRLEQVAAQIATLEEVLEKHCQALDSLPALQAELATEMKKHQELTNRLRERENALRAWGEWRALRLRYQSALKEQGRLEQALERARELAAREAGLRAEIEVAYPEFMGVPGETGSLLIALKELTTKVENRMAETVTLDQELAALQEEAKGYLTLLQDEFAAVEGRQSLLQDHKELLLLLRQKEDLVKRLEGLRGNGARAREKLAQLWPWEQLGPSPTVVLPERRETAIQLSREWQDYCKARTEVEQISAELCGELGWFETASPEAREACCDYHAQRERAIWSCDQAEAARDHARARITGYEKARMEWRQEYGILAGMGEDADRAMEAKQKIQEEKAELTRKAMSSGAGKPRAAWHKPWLWAAAMLSLILVPVYWPLAVGVVLAAGCGYWWWFRRSGGNVSQVPEALARELEAKETALMELEKGYPFLAGWDQAELIRARERWRLCRVQGEALEAQAGELPSPEDVAALNNAVARTRDALEMLERLTLEPRRLFSDVVRFHARWQDLRGRRERACKDLSAWTQKEFHCLPEEVSTCGLNKVAERWQQLLRLAEIEGIAMETAGQLLEWLTGLDDDWWGKALQQAGEWEAAVKETNRALQGEAEILGEAQDGITPMDRLDNAIQLLRRGIAPFDEGTTPEELQLMVNGCQELHGKIHAQNALIGEKGRRLRELKAELGAWQGEVEALTTNLVPLLAAAGGGVEKALERWGNFQIMADATDEAAKNLGALLGGQEAASMESLRIKALDAGNQAGRARANWEELVSVHPGLPDANVDEDVEGSYRSLADEVNELARQAEDAGRKIEGLQSRQAGLQGITPVNLASVGEQLERLRDEKRQLELEVEALALAYRELELSAQEFQASHRQRFAQKATEHFAALSGIYGRRVDVEEDFHISLVLETGRTAQVSQLSQGAQDQLYLALRLAMADLLSGDLVLPFIFDDPFLNFDEGRLEFARVAIGRLSEERQVLLLSHRGDFARWSTDVR